MMKTRLARARARVAASMVFGALCAMPVAAQAATANSGPCMNELRTQSFLTLAPQTASPTDSNGGFINRLAVCNMWQNFFYLNWPALSGHAGQPNPKATFGAAGATVWQTYMSPDKVFLKNGAKPAPWGTLSVDADVPSAIAAQVKAGTLRVLRHTSKITSSDVALRDELQVDGFALFDQQTNPVYYEVGMNKTEYDYIVSNHLYEANAQAAYAKKKAIAPPVGSFEIKAAWKVLTTAEASSGRFFTSQAFVVPPGGAGSVQTVGLVGLHVFAGGGSASGNSAGLWATFYQTDNAPLAGHANPSGTYNFYNPQSQATANTPTLVDGKQVATPTQVTQVWADDVDALTVTQYAQTLIVGANQQAPWQYYNLIDTQWPRAPYSTAVPPAPQQAPLPLQNPNTEQMLNPVVETYMQVTQQTHPSQRSCMACHSFGSVADKKLKYATGFSFLFGRAQAAKPSKAPAPQ